MKFTFKSHPKFKSFFIIGTILEYDIFDIPPKVKYTQVKLVVCVTWGTLPGTGKQHYLCISYLRVHTIYPHVGRLIQVRLAIHEWKVDIFGNVNVLVQT